MNDLRKLESTAITATVLAYVFTVALVGGTALEEANPFALGIVERVGWAGAGVLAISVEAGIFAAYRRLESHFPRTVRGGAFLLAGVGVADLAVNLVGFARVGGPETISLVPLIEATAPVVFVGILAIARPSLSGLRNIVATSPRPGKPSRQTIATLGLVLLMLTSLPAPFANLSATQTVSAAPGGQLWSASTGGQIDSSPTVANGTVYIASTDNSLYAFDVETGAQEWSAPTGGSIYQSSPTVANGTVYIGSRDNSLYAFDAETGDQKWSAPTGDGIDSSPTVANGTVYVGSWDTSVYAFDAETGGEEWSTPTGGRIDSSPTVVNGTVYIGSADSSLHALDAQTGVEEWNKSTGSDIVSSPTVKDGTVYVGSYDGSFYAVDAGTGDEEWSVSIGSLIDSSPTVANGTVYFGSKDNNLYALDAGTGAEEWNSTTGNFIQTSSPTVAAGTVYIGSTDNSLYAFDAETGDEKWNTPTGDDIVSSPTVSNGTVYVGSRDNSLYAFETDHTDDSSGSRNELHTLGHVGPVEGTTSIVSGTVTDESGSAISGATVEIEDSGGTVIETHTTDANGQWSTELGDGDYTAVTNADGYNTNSKAFTVSGSAVTVDQTLSATKYSVEGYVLDSSGNTVGGANVSISDGGGVVATTTANSGGKWSASLENGTYTAEASAPTYFNGSTTLDVAGAVSGQNITLSQQSVAGVVTDGDGERVENATVEIVGVDEKKVTLEQGETYEEKATELLEKSSSPFPPSYDSDLQITGEGGVAQQASGEYVAIHRPEDWATKGWVDTIELDNPTVNPPAEEPITLSVWNPSMGEGALTIQNTVDDDLRGAVVNRTIVIEQLDPYGDVVDRRKLEANRNKRTGIGPGSRDHPYVQTSLPAGVYRVYAEGDKQTAYTMVVGNTADLRETFATELENQAGEQSKAANEIREKFNEGTFVRETVTTDENGRYNATITANVKVVAVSSYKVDGKVLTSMNDPTPQDMRAWVVNNDYNGSVYFSVEPRKHEAPTEAADVTVRKFSSPPYPLLDSWASNWASFRETLENGTLTELGTMYSVPLSEWNESEKEAGAEDLAKVIESNNQELIDAWEEKRGEDWEQFREELEESERSNRELREDIRTMEQTITSLQSEMKSEAPETSVGDSEITFRQAFDGDFEKADVIATWNDYDGSSSPIPDQYIAVNKRVGQGDEIVVENYPIPNESAGGQVSVTVVSEEGEIGHGSEQIENPAFTGDVPELRSIDASTLRPGPSETVTLSPKFDSAGVSVEKVEVFDDSGSEISSSLSNGKAKFTPENSGIYFVRFTFNTTDDDRFVQSLRMPVEPTSHDWPASVHVRDGRLGTFAVAGANVKDAKVTMQNSGGGIKATALVDPDSGVNEVHYYLEGAPQGVEQDITTRVIEGRNIDTGTSISRHVGVYLHGREISDNAAVYRKGSGTDASKIPIPHDGETRGGELRQDEQGGTVIHSYTSRDGETTITIDNSPGRVEGWQYRLALFVERRDVPFAVAVPDFDAFDTTTDVANHLFELVDDANGFTLEFDVDAPGVGPDPTADLPSTGAIA